MTKKINLISQAFSKYGYKRPSHLASEADLVQGKLRIKRNTSRNTSKTSGYVGLRYKLVIDENGVESLMEK